MPITPLPTPPSRQDPSNFADRGDAFLGALPLFAVQANALASTVNAYEIAAAASSNSASSSASAALSSQNAAYASASQAAASNGAALWVSGTTYGAGALVYSPIDGRIYRRLTAGAGTTDPSTDTGNWVIISIVVEQADIGTAANEVPLNQYLGALAYQDQIAYPMLAGSGITGSGTIYRAMSLKTDGIITTKLLIDLTGLNSGGTAGDIIGGNGLTNCHIGQIDANRTGTILGGRMTCLETPAGGDTDIDLYSANEGTGAEDAAISGLTETQLINAGSQTIGTITYLSSVPANLQYLYFVGQGTANTTYTAGIFLIELFGVA